MLKSVFLAAASFGLVSFAGNAQVTQRSGSAAPSGKSEMQSQPKATVASQARAKEIYGYDCAVCHGTNGDGKTGAISEIGMNVTDLTDPATLASKSDQELLEIINKGKGKMPGEGTRVGGDEAWNLVLYVRGLSKKGSSMTAKDAQ